MPGVAEAESGDQGGAKRMDVSTEQFLWGGRLIGYLAALGVFVVSMAFGVLVVRPWQRESTDPARR
jgi:hypothetical protein